MIIKTTDTLHITCANSKHPNLFVRIFTNSSQGYKRLIPERIEDIANHPEDFKKSLQRSALLQTPNDFNHQKCMCTYFHKFSGWNPVSTLPEDSRHCKSFRGAQERRPERCNSFISLVTSKMASLCKLILTSSSGWFECSVLWMEFMLGNDWRHAH